MELDKTLADIRQKLGDARYPNEQSISQGIVLRVLKELDWDVYDTNIVWPEFSTGEGRVDFALCDPPSKPKCFVEVKQPGKAEDGEQQAMAYAFHCGVPFLVLTDGQTWSFYLPAEQGGYKERRVFKLDLFERAMDESARVLQDYLGLKKVVSGEALATARLRIRDNNRRSVARHTIPEAWKELVEKGNESLRDLLANAVESKSGFRPDNTDIADFLASCLLPGPKSDPGETLPPSPRSGKDPIPPTDRTVVLRGKKIPCKTAGEAMVIILRELAKEDPAFLQRCSDDRRFHGRKRRLVARRAEDIYPGSVNYQRRGCKKLPGNWLVGTRMISDQRRRELIEAAAEIAKLTFGQDIIVWF